MKSPFEEKFPGCNWKTEFVVVGDQISQITVGQIVTLHRDDNTGTPQFKVCGEDRLVKIWIGDLIPKKTGRLEKGDMCLAGYDRESWSLCTFHENVSGIKALAPFLCYETSTGIFKNYSQIIPLDPPKNQSIKFEDGSSLVIPNHVAKKLKEEYGNEQIESD